MSLFTSEKLNEFVWRIACPGNVFVYYVEGSQSGLLIDTGLGYGNLKEYVDSIASKPYTVILTHGHLDHAGGAYSFDSVYLNSLDFDMALLHGNPEMRKSYLEQNGVNVDTSLLVPCRTNAYLPLENEQVFDLGNVKVQALSMQGHTNGCMAILINRSILFGDACNSLAFMQFEDCIPLSVYALKLKEFKNKYEELYDEIWYSHPHNFGRKEILDEMIDLCENIWNGSIQGIPFQEGVLLALPIDSSMKRLDGHIANVAYLRNSIK